jgi:peptide-methionine (S)-S-oxide reductase
MATETATLAAGCFWCVEAVFDGLAGVESVESGYIGGRVVDPTYKQVCGGDTGHAEAIRIVFDPEIVSFDEMLDIFFEIHDPTQLNRQGNDVGTQYRSAIFPHSPEQEAAARGAIARAQAEGAANPYCQIVVAPKLAKFRKKHADRLKAAALT